MEITILGSCVTRDAFEIREHFYTINDYYARSSLISIASKPLEINFDDILLESEFQKKCVYNDFKKNFLIDIEEKKSKYLIIDLIDERFNLLQFGDSYVTKSNELVSAKMDISKFVEVKKGEDILPIWEQHASIFFEKLFKVYNKSQIILHKAFWKEFYFSKNGEKIEFINNISGIRYHNLLLTRYYQFIEKNYSDIKIIDMTQYNYFSSENHKWGLSPYHFQEEYYNKFIQELKKITIDCHENYFLMKTKFGNVNIMTSYDHKHTYLDFATASNIARTKDLKMDEHGIPLLKVGSQGQYGYQYYPITIGFYGLECISKYYLSKNDSFLNEFNKICDYLLQNQNENGAWAIHFDYSYGVKESGVIKAPWISALAQGCIISCLVRAYYLTLDNKYIIAAKRATVPFKTDVEEGGVRRNIFNKYICYEEYPTPTPTHILNGFMFALLGLYDLVKAIDDKEVANLYYEGINSLKSILSMYDLGNISSYDLTHLVIPGNASKFHYGYHLTHIKQLSAINLIESDEIIEKVKQRWITYAQGNQSCFRLSTEKINLMINGEVNCKYLKENMINYITITYDIDEPVQYAAYVYYKNERILTKKYDESESFKITVESGIYKIAIFVKDQFNNTVSKEYQLEVFGEEIYKPLDKGYFVKNTDIRINKCKLLVRINIQNDNLYEFAYYVLLNKNVIHKEWYNTNQFFEFNILVSGEYEIVIFIRNKIGETISYTTDSIKGDLP